MPTDLFWIDGPWPGKLAISPRPRGGEWLADELAAWRRAGVTTVVSLLTAEESLELDLHDEAGEVAAGGIGFVSYPVVDRGVPSSSVEYRRLLSELAIRLANGQTVAVHCRQGIGRAALVAIGLLLAGGIGIEAAIDRVGQARGRPVPETAEQRRWIEEQARAPFTQAA